MRRTRFLTLLLLLSTMIVNAASYKILKLNHPQILINGKQAREGDVFHDNDVIRWSKDKQAMKVIDMDTSKRYLFVSQPHNKKEEKVIEIFTRINHLSTHRPNDQALTSEFDKLENSILSRYYLFDTIEIPTSISVDENHYFLGSYKYGDTRIIKKLNYQHGNIIIDKTIFHVDNKRLDPRDIELTIDYVVKTPDNAVFIKDGIELIIIPEVLE